MKVVTHHESFQVLLIIEVAVMQKAVDSGIGRHSDTLAEAAIQTASKVSQQQPNLSR